MIEALNEVFTSGVATNLPWGTTQKQFDEWNPDLTFEDAMTLFTEGWHEQLRERTIIIEELNYHQNEKVLIIKYTPSIPGQPAVDVTITFINQNDNVYRLSAIKIEIEEEEEEEEEEIFLPY